MPELGFDALIDITQVEFSLWVGVPSKGNYGRAFLQARPNGAIIPQTHPRGMGLFVSVYVGLFFVLFVFFFLFFLVFVIQIRYVLQVLGDCGYAVTPVNSRLDANGFHQFVHG